MHAQLIFNTAIVGVVRFRREGEVVEQRQERCWDSWGTAELGLRIVKECGCIPCSALATICLDLVKLYKFRSDVS